MTEQEKRKAVLEFLKETAAKGGIARAKSMNKARLSEIGKQGAKIRWAKKKA